MAAGLLLSQLSRGGVSLKFYPGGADQIQDSEEVSRDGRSATQQPAYRHLTSVKLNSLPIGDFGNRIPNMTSVIAFQSAGASPAILMAEPSGFNPPGSLTGADTSYMAYDQSRNRLIGLKAASNGVWTANGSSMTFRSFVDDVDTATAPAYGLDGFIYSQLSGNNRARLEKISIDTGQIVGSVGNTGPLGLADDEDGFGNAGEWYALTTTIRGLGRRTLAIHINSSFPASGPPNGSVVDGDALTVIDAPTTAILHTISTADGLVNDGGPLAAVVLPDHDRGRFFILQQVSTGPSYVLVKYEPSYVLGINGVTFNGLDISVVRTFTAGTFGTDDFGGTGEPTGWAINRKTGDLMMSNGSSIVLYNPDTDQILAQKNNSHMRGRHNYYSGGIFAFAQSRALADGGGRIFTVDTRTLETLSTLSMDAIEFTGAQPGVFHEESQVWDDRAGALYLSRVESGGTAIVGERVVKILVNRVNGLGVGLDTVVSALCTEYQNIKMADLVPADFDVTTLASDTVQGYTLNNKTTIRSALEPLRTRFQFDGVQSDWIIKFPKRGGASVLTIPEEFVGELKRGRTERDDAPVVEVRTQDAEIPVKVNVRYRNKDAAYDIDAESDRRQRFPVSTQAARSEQTLDIPIVDTPSGMKPIAQNWLWTLWNERRQFKTIVPWTYMELDPTDVFSMGVFGETNRLRLVDQDIGHGFAMDITGVAEETYTFASTLPAGEGLGRPLNVIPSNLPTIPLFLDAPLLDFADINLAAVSNAYIAAGALESSWRGATFIKSIDDIDYQVTNSTSFEATTGKVRVQPPALAFGDGNPSNKILEVADGGTMTISPLRGADNWLSATELNMLNGANNFAIIYPDGTMQIAQYVDATVNSDDTITLERLLLGRQGTEDIAATQPPLASDVVLLSNNTGVAQSGAIRRQSLALADLNTALFFKAVTIGTLQEDADASIFTYTGRDIKPFSVADVQTAVVDGDFTVTWERRTRGPGQGEWLDLEGTVPLNETQEQYEVTLSTPTAVDFITKTVNNVRSASFTFSELALGGSATILAKQPWPNRAGDTVDGTMDSPGAEDPLIDGGWVNESGVGGWTYSSGTNGFTDGPVPGTETRVSPVSTKYLRQANGGATPVIRELSNTIDLVTDLGLTASQFEGAALQANVWMSQGVDQLGGSPHRMRIALELLDVNDNVLASQSHLDFRAKFDANSIADGEWISVGSIYDVSADDYSQRNLAVPLDTAGAAKVRVQLGITKGGTSGTTGRGAFDHLEVQVVAPPSELTVKVVQVSASGLKSPITSKQVTT